MRNGLAPLFMALAIGAARAEKIDVYETVDPAPDAIAALVTCDPVGASAHVIPFAGGVLFKMRCPGNNANYRQGFVFAQDKAGTGAHTLLFPVPGGAEPQDALSNSRLIIKRAEITELSVNPEVAICRTEGRWRLEGPERTPRLLFWRETKDCEGRKGWRVRVNTR